MKTHDLLIDAALSLFAQNDYGNVTTRKIVAEAGVALPTLHRHFDTKENLFREVIRTTYARLDKIRSNLLDELSEAENHSAIISAAIRAHLDFVSEDPRPLRFLVRMAHDPTAPRDQYTQSRDEFLNYVTALFPPVLPPAEMRTRVQVFLFGFSRFITLDRKEICEIMQIKTWKEARIQLETILIDAAHDCVKLPYQN
jgi:AcrR family transcriptional regulator